MSNNKLEKCQYCGEGFKNVGAHLRHCKAKKAQEALTDITHREPTERPDSHTEPAQDENTGQAIQTPAQAQTEPTEKPQGRKWGIFKAKTEEPAQDEPRTEPPLKMNLDKLDLHEVEGATDEEKLKRFFADLPKWTIKKPQGIRGKLFKLFNGNTTLKPCVFVSEHEEPKLCYVPYDPKKEIMVNPKTGEIYEPPIKGNVAFFHADKFRPLVGSRDPGDMYDLPEHYALKLYNMGLQEAQLKGFEELIAHIKKFQYVAYAALGLSIIVFIGAVILVKSNSTALEIAAQEMGNVTRMYGGV